VPIVNPETADMSEPASSTHNDQVARQAKGRRLIGRRGLVLALGGLVGSGVLAGCSTGSSREAERGRRRDAERTSIVDEVQATRTASLILGTPPATPGTPED
jgi:hypothetical protein